MHAAQSRVAQFSLRQAKMRGTAPGHHRAGEHCSADATWTKHRVVCFRLHARLSHPKGPPPHCASSAHRGTLMSSGAQASRPAVWNIDTAARSFLRRKRKQSRHRSRRRNTAMGCRRPV